MGRYQRFQRVWAEKKRLHLTATQTIALVFAALILVGALLLNLPMASRNGQSAGFLPSLFTATSATCVTGLVLFDTWTQWSSFGQTVILLLIEVGGLGFMSVSSLVVFLLRRRIGLKQRMVMAQALSVDDMDSVVKLQKWVILGSLSIQLCGALVLFARFLPQYGWQRAAWWGVFHAVSAFCNAGFDVVGSVAPGANMMVFQKDPVVLVTLMALIVVGGLGFFVWDEVARLHSFRKFSVYTKLVLITTAALLVGGAAAICVVEWNNPDTLGTMTSGEKILNGIFQAVTLRTAGFASVDQGLLTDAGKGISMVLMLIGGSSGSTAGGIKTVTVITLLLFIWNRARGRQTVCVFKRSIPEHKVMDAMTIFGIMICLAFAGGVFICATSPVSLTDGLYESVSALATVGLSAGNTSCLHVAAKVLIIIYMYFGRVGVLTISLGLLMGDRVEERFRYAYTNLLIG